MQYITKLEGLSETKAKQVFEIVAQKIMEKVNLQISQME